MRGDRVGHAPADGHPAARVSVGVHHQALSHLTGTVMPDADFGAEYLRHLEAQRLSPATVNTRRAECDGGGNERAAAGSYPGVAHGA